MGLNKPNRPKKYKRDNNVYVETVYGSYVNEKDYGMAQQKNAVSELFLKRNGYIRIQ